MNELIIKQRPGVCHITFNRIEVGNAFHRKMLQSLQHAIDTALSHAAIQVIALSGNGKNFCLGADLHWMQEALTLSPKDNYEDALILAKLLYTLHTAKKPIITIAHGASFGGGVGLLAASTIAIASTHATFCFSEIHLGLIPATISPYVIHTIGKKNATWLFLSAHRFDAIEAKSLGLLQYIVSEEELLPFGLDLAETLSRYPKETLKHCKQFMDDITPPIITQELIEKTALLLAKQRTSQEAKDAVSAFLSKKNSSVQGTS